MFDLSLLPDLCLLIILGYLPIVDLLHVSALSSQLHRIAAEVCRRKTSLTLFGDSECQAKLDLSLFDWYEVSPKFDLVLRYQYTPRAYGGQQFKNTPGPLISLKPDYLATEYR